MLDPQADLQRARHHHILVGVVVPLPSGHEVPLMPEALTVAGLLRALAPASLLGHPRVILPKALSGSERISIEPIAQLLIPLVEQAFKPFVDG